MTTKVTYVKLFNPQLLTTTAQLIYQLQTVPASLEFRGGRVRIVNVTGSAISFTLFAVPNGVSGLPNSTIFAANVPVASGLFFDIDVPVLSIGDALWAQCNTASAAVIQFMNGVLIQ
jgi:hypothetical protein